jgi:beta-N-acetylhexosaminidase
VGAEAARRALEVSGDVAVAGPILVLELVPEANIAAGEALHGLADVLPDAVAVRVGEEPADLASLLAEHEGRRLVVVARDAARHPWQESTVAKARAVRRDLIVVETGIPGDGAFGADHGDRPGDRPRSIVTHGGGRANLAAAADALSG